jgi:hypothetical protein
VEAFKKGMQATLLNNSTAYGFSIMITSTFGAVSIEDPSLTTGRLFLFLAGGVLSFAAIEAAASGLFRRRLESEPSDVVALGSSFALFSVAAAVGVAVLVAQLLAGWASWFFAPFLASAVYVLLAGVEMAVAVRLKHDA